MAHIGQKHIEEIENPELGIERIRDIKQKMQTLFWRVSANRLE